MIRISFEELVPEQVHLALHQCYIEFVAMHSFGSGSTCQCSHLGAAASRNLENISLNDDRTVRAICMGDGQCRNLRQTVDENLGKQILDLFKSQEQKCVFHVLVLRPLLAAATLAVPASTTRAAALSAVVAAAATACYAPYHRHAEHQAQQSTERTGTQGQQAPTAATALAVGNVKLHFAAPPPAPGNNRAVDGEKTMIYTGF